MNELQNEKRFYTVKEFHELLSGVVTKSMIYKMIDAGEIPTRRIGNKIVIHKDWITSYLDAPCISVKKIRDKRRAN